MEVEGRIVASKEKGGYCWLNSLMFQLYKMNAFYKLLLLVKKRAYFQHTMDREMNHEVSPLPKEGPM